MLAALPRILFARPMGRGRVRDMVVTVAVATVVVAGGASLIPGAIPGGGGGGTGECAVATPHVPDGPDNNGGCWPGPSNTGPAAAQGTMTAYTGTCTINTPNVTIDSKIIDCDFIVNSGGTNFRITNSYLYGTVEINNGGSFTMEDTYLKGTEGSLGTGFDCICDGVTGSNFTIRSSEIDGTNKGFWCLSTCTIEDSYIHTSRNLDPWSNAHASGGRPEQYTTMTHNAIGCRYDGPFAPNAAEETGCSAGTTGYPDFQPIHHNTWDRNLFLANGGASFCMYGGGTGGKPYSNDPQNATYQVVTNNVFQRTGDLTAYPTTQCAYFGPVTDFMTGRTGNVWSNNKYDNGTTVNPA